MKSLSWVCASVVEPTPEAEMDRSLEPMNLKPDWTISQSHTHIPPPDKLSYIQPLKQLFQEDMGRRDDDEHGEWQEMQKGK